MVLEQGALSGKYDTKHPMPEGSARAETYNPVLDKLEILNGELKKLADKYGVGMAQIPVAWAIAKGTLPIIGVTLALYPCPVIVVGAMVNDKPTWTLVAHAGTVAHSHLKWCRKK